MNPEFTHQLVMRRDTRTGLVCIGWARDMPLERYEHLSLIIESNRAAPLLADTDYYAHYVSACNEARALNQAILARQSAQYARDGWLVVPLDLRAEEAACEPDSVGSYQQAAMQALHRLTRNVTEVWAACDGGQVRDVCACSPPRPMEAVEFQVWRQQMHRRLHEQSARVYSGKLMVTHSGLWFNPDKTEA